MTTANYVSASGVIAKSEKPLSRGLNGLNGLRVLV